jgi:putative nucleotidyltransferase with HDIG domain
MQVPTIAECARLMEEHGMLPNIRHHSLVVARIADLLALRLQEKLDNDVPVPDRNLCISGALLHDIAKTPCLDGSCDHALEGAVICRAQGYPEISEIVAQHVILNHFADKQYRKGVFSAVEIVYYADKRVRHDEIVSLEERLEYILAHYGKNDARLYQLIRENFSQCVRLEKYLFSFLDFSQKELAAKVMTRNSNTKSLLYA